MEPHRWLPLEANPDVSAGLGGGEELLGAREGGLPACLPVGEKEGRRMAEGENLGPLRAQDRGVSGGWWGQGVGKVLASGYSRGLNSLLFSAFFSGHESGKQLLFEVIFSLSAVLGPSPFVFM